METGSIISHGIPMEFMQDAYREGSRVQNGLLQKEEGKGKERRGFFLNNERCSDDLRKACHRKKEQVCITVFI